MRLIHTVLTSVRCHINIMAWSDDSEELRRIKNDVGGPVGDNGMYAPAQHHRLPDTVLVGDTR